MKFSTTLLMLTLFVGTAFGQSRIKLSKNITTETKNIKGFSEIEVGEDFHVFVDFSGEEGVRIEANENLHEYIKVEKKGETLKIYTKSYSSWGGNVEEKLVAYISAKTLTAIYGEEDVIITLEDQLKADKLTIDLTEDSVLKGHLEVDELIVELDEDSELHIEGSASKMEVDADEDSIIESFDFVVGDLDINLSEDSEAKLTVNGKINLRASGDSYFYKKGDGNFVTKRLTGDSEVKSR